MLVDNRPGKGEANRSWLTRGQNLVRSLTF